MGPLGAVDHLRVRERICIFLVGVVRGSDPTPCLVVLGVVRGSNPTPCLVVLRRMGTFRFFQMNVWNWKAEGVRTLYSGDK